jgi:hypothetical protein
MAPDEQHERLAKKVDAELDDLAREGERLDREIDQVRSQWRAKQDDPAVPGAVSTESADGSASADGPGNADEP